MDRNIKSDAVERQPDTPPVEQPQSAGVERKDTTTLSESERQLLRQEVLDEMTAEETTVSPAVRPAQPAAAPVVSKSKTVVAVEHILEEDLREMYQRLSPHEQQQFKTVGETTATKIATLLQTVKIKSQEIFQLIASWLKLIPGANRFFIAQAAKIKTDKILKINRPS